MFSGFSHRCREEKTLYGLDLVTDASVYWFRMAKDKVTHTIQTLTFSIKDFRGICHTTVKIPRQVAALYDTDALFNFRSGDNLNTVIIVLYFEGCMRKVKKARQKAIRIQYSTNSFQKSLSCQNLVKSDNEKDWHVKL